MNFAATLDRGDQLDLHRLEAADFPVVRRGFDRARVTADLRSAVEEIRRLRAWIDQLQSRIEEQESIPPSELRAKEVTEALGEEAVRVLEAARVAAQQRAERAAAEREQLLVQARSDAAQIVDESRAQGREIVAEARAVRKQMLGELARKRQVYRAEIEQLRAAADRLLESFASTQQELDRSVAGLIESVPEARAAAERAGLRIAAEPETTAEALETELDAARIIGHPMVEPSDRSGAVGDGVPRPEPEIEPRPEPEIVPPPQTEVVPPPQTEVEAENEVEDINAPSGIDDLFARLRTAVPEDHEERPDEIVTSTTTATGSNSDRTGVEEAVDAARSAAIGEITRALKQRVVDEQGELLDALRREGAAAIANLLTDRDAAASFTAVVPGPLQDYASDIDVKVSEFDVDAATAAITETLVAPMRNRLREALDRTTEVAELNAIVSVLYRESRTRRAPRAAESALAAVGSPQNSTEV